MACCSPNPSPIWCSASVPTSPTRNTETKRGGRKAALFVSRQHQRLGAAMKLQMFLDHLIHRRETIQPVPDALRVEHGAGAKLAAVQAAGLVDADILQAEFLHPDFHVVT